MLTCAIDIDSNESLCHKNIIYKFRRKISIYWDKKYGIHVIWSEITCMSNEAAACAIMFSIVMYFDVSPHARNYEQASTLEKANDIMMELHVCQLQ